MKKNTKTILIQQAVALGASTALWAVICWVNATPLVWSYGAVMPFVIPAFCMEAIILLYEVMEDCEYAPGIISGILSGIAFVIMLIIPIGSSEMFNSWRYANSVGIENIDIADSSIPTEEDINNLFLMDSDTALQLATRKVGENEDIVSQYNPNRCWSQIVNGEAVKVVDLQYAGLFQCTHNESIPIFAIVHADQKVDVVEVKGGIVYAPSDIMSQDLKRHVKRCMPGKLLGNYYFQVSDDLHPYWTVEVMEYKTLLGCKTVKGAVLCDAVTGECSYYSLADVPEWCDCIVNGDEICEYYNRYGELSNGFWNLSKRGMKVTTDDYGYVMIDNDVYVYTGVTSVSGDESNVGVLLVNSRTNEYEYCAIGGAEEHSAMDEAATLISNFGYVASFPSLIMYNGEPTYIMIMKDSSSLIKRYAMVNYSDYSMAVIDETLEGCQKKYAEKLGWEVSEETVESVSESVETPEIQREYTSVTIVIADIRYADVDGNTYVYIADTDGNIYREKFADDASLMFLSVGDTVEIKITEENGFYSFMR